MDLEKVLKDIDIHDKMNWKNIDITNISSDSRYIKKDGLFFAINGYNKDGIDFIPSAISNNAVAIIVEDSVDITTLDAPSNMPIISVSNIRKSLAIASSNLYNNSHFHSNHAIY